MFAEDCLVNNPPKELQNDSEYLAQRPKDALLGLTKSSNINEELRITR